MYFEMFVPNLSIQGLVNHKEEWISLEIMNLLISHTLDQRLPRSKPRSVSGAAAHRHGVAVRKAFLIHLSYIPIPTSRSKHQESSSVTFIDDIWSINVLRCSDIVLTWCSCSWLSFGCGRLRVRRTLLATVEITRR